MNKTEYLQQKIKKSLKKLKWTYKEFVENFNEEFNEYIIEENIKKQLNRKSTNPELLKKYLLYLNQEEEICETYIFDDEFDTEFNKKLKEISQNMYEKIAEKM